jgi:hypothetical protein
MNTEEDSEYSAYERHLFKRDKLKHEDRENFLKVQKILDDHFKLLDSE